MRILILIPGAMFFLMIFSIGCSDDHAGSSDLPVIQQQFTAFLVYEPTDSETVPGEIVFLDVELVATKNFRADITSGVLVCSEQQGAPCCTPAIEADNTLSFESCRLVGDGAYEQIEIATNSDNPIQSFSATLTAPSGPPNRGCAYTWPGLEPSANDTESDTYKPIGEGVLQPVMTYGNLCNAPNPTGVDRSNTWWISGQYVNDLGVTVEGEKVFSPGCGNLDGVAPDGWKGGDNVLLDFGESVKTKMEFVEGLGWVQTIEKGAEPSVDWCLELAPGNPGCPAC